MREQLIATFEELKIGVRQLQEQAERGETQAVVDGMIELLAALGELQAAVMSAAPSDA